MHSPFIHILLTPWHERIAWFWPIWITTTVVAAAGVAWVVRRPEAATLRAAKQTPDTRAERNTQPAGTIVALTLLAVFVVCIVAITLKWEDFADYDDAYYTIYTLKGHNFAPPIWPQVGRFYPLADQEFNLVRHFTASSAGYHALPLAELLAVTCIILLLDDELSIIVRAALAGFVLMLPSMVVSFTGLAFPERNVVLCLACFVLFVKRFEETHSVGWAVAAAVSAQVMIYYKETAVLLLLSFALGRLIFRCWKPGRPGWNWQALRDQDSRLDLCLVCLGSMFLLYYLAAMYPRPNLQYANLMGLPLGQVISFFFEVDLLAWLFLAVALRRFYLIVRGRAEFCPLWDGLAIGAVVYFLAFVYLRLAALHYTSALDLIAVLYLGRLAVLASEKMPLWGKVAASALALVIVFQAVSISAFRIFERKNYIHGKAEIASVIAAQYRGYKGIGQRLFFPFADIYPLSEFAAYLSYRGVPVEGDSSGPTASKGAVIVSGVVDKEEPCVPYRDVVCHPGTRPEPGDLVIELPDDLESLSAISPYRSGGELLLSYEPRPRIPRWLYPFVARLRVAAVRSTERDGLSDRWLHASVTRWKESNPPSAERHPLRAPGGG